MAINPLTLPVPPGQANALALPGSPRGSAGAGLVNTLQMSTHTGGRHELCKVHCSLPPLAEDPAMATAAQVVPSPQARTLFNQMAVLARPLGEDRNTLHIDVGNVLAVACRRARRGEDAKARDEITELQAEDWIKPAPSGGWFLG